MIVYQLTEAGVPYNIYTYECTCVMSYCMIIVEMLTARHWFQESTRTSPFCTRTWLKPRNQEPRLRRPMKVNLGLGCVL